MKTCFKLGAFISAPHVIVFLQPVLLIDFVTTVSNISDPNLAPGNKTRDCSLKSVASIGP